MKIKMIVVLSVVAAVAFIIGGAACSHASKEPTLASATNNATAADAKPKPYPFDTCLVDGMKLGSMGDPYVFAYQGQEIKFCCPDCKPEFLKDPDKYMKKIQDAETAAIK
jgi:YHS domain-containing protein